MTELNTERLMLREFTPDDAQFIFNLLNDTSFIRFIGDKGVRTIDDARNYLINGPIASYQLHDFGLYLVELKDTAVPIGMCGILKREALEDVDLGFAFMPDYRRQGYGFEAATAVLSHTKDVHEFDRILAITNPENNSSIKLLERLGFKFERMIRLPGDTSEIKLFAMSGKR